MEQEFSIPTNTTSLEYIITSTISKDKILTELQYLEDQESEIQDKFDKISLDNETDLNIFADKLSLISDKIDELKEKLSAQTDNSKPNFIDSYKDIYKSLVIFIYFFMINIFVIVNLYIYVNNFQASQFKRYNQRTWIHTTDR